MLGVGVNGDGHLFGLLFKLSLVNTDCQLGKLYTNSFMSILSDTIGNVIISLWQVS